MAKEMLINVSEGEECRIALLEDGKLEELYMERSSSTSHVGNIYKGRVTNVEASIQAAFVDFGLGRNGFLHISDLMPTYFGQGGGDIHESVGRKMSRRDRPPIQRCLRRGDELIVQIIKEGIGTKGPTLSTYVSIPGRILVMMPGMGKFGVSRKIEDDGERRRLRTILDSLKPLKDVGFIIRTAGIGKTKTDIQRDLTYLTRLWQTIEKKMSSGKGPMELYTEGDLVTRTVRDVFTNDIERVIIDSKDVAKRVKEVIKLSNPRTRNKVELYEGVTPLFNEWGIEREIEQMYSRHVPLPSGGSLVIDSTEAVVAIDVNSGKFREHNDAEMTAFKTDMEAADEIPRQLKLRDLGGVIICDFIDLRFERNRRELEKRLHDNLSDDRAKTKVLRMSQFGIIEMTRQRMRPSLKRSIYSDCPHCHGTGLVKTPESMSLDVMRRLAIAAHDQRVVRVELTVCPEVASFLLNRKRTQLSDIENEVKKSVLILQDPKLGLDDARFELFDLRDGMVYLAELGMLPPGQGGEENRRGGQQNSQRSGRNEQRGGRDRGGRGGQRPGGPNNRNAPPAPAPRHVEDRNDEEFEDHDRDEFQKISSRSDEHADKPLPDEDAIDDSIDDAADDERPSDRPSKEIVSDNEEADDDGAELKPAAAPLAARQGRPTTRGPSRPPMKPASRDDDLDDDLADDDFDEEESQVIEVDDPTEPMGDGPEPFEEDRPRNYRDRGNRGGSNRNGPNRNAPNRNAPIRNEPNRNEPNRNAGDRNRPNPQIVNRGPVNRDVVNRDMANAGGNRGGNGGNENPGNEQPANRAGPNDGENGEGGGRRRRRRGRRGRGRGGRNENGQPNEGVQNDGRPNAPRGPVGANPQRALPTDRIDNPDGDYVDDSAIDHVAERPTSVVSETSVEAYGKNEVETESIEATFDETGKAEAEDRATGEGAGENASDDPNAPRRRRRRRGGRRHRRRREQQAAGQGGAEAGDHPELRPEGDSTSRSDEAGLEADEMLDDANDRVDDLVTSAANSDSREPQVMEADSPVKELTTSGEEEPAGEVEAEVEPVPAPKRRGRAVARPKRTPPPGTTARAPRKTAAVKSTALKLSAAKAAAEAAAAEKLQSAQESVVIPRTGSSDKHLINDDVPVDPEPPRRPKSVRDLDAIPDDYDE